METKERQEQARAEGLTRLFRKTLHLLEQAIAAISILALLVALGLAGMWLAVFADVGVMVLAVLNAIRALLVKKTK